VRVGTERVEAWLRDDCTNFNFLIAEAAEANRLIDFSRNDYVFRAVRP
jgi:hypothetical protein